MPWTAAEAKSHTKSASTPKKQRQWAHVANAMLKKTKSEAKAIRAANAAVSGDAIVDLDAWMDEWLEDEGRRKKTKRDPRGRLISTETEEDDGVDVSVIGDAEPESLQMFDAVELDDAAKARVTSDGYLVANPRIARTGIQVYAGDECGVPEMDEVRVYRPETSVFDAAAVHSYTHLPVTLGHPKVLVNSKNWKDHAVGDTGDEVLRDGGTVRIPMMVRDETAVRAIRDGRDQLSVGYTCDLDWGEGVTSDGEQYDAVQTNIRANHLAIVAAARGGSRLRVGDDQQQHTEDHTMQLKNVTVDGIECQMTDTAASVVQRTIQRLNDDLVKASKNVVAANEQYDEVQEKLDELTRKSDEAVKAKDAQIAVLTQQVKDAQDPAKLDAAINDRLAVFTVARRIMGDSYKSDGKSIVDVRKEVVNAKANLGDVTKTWGDAEFKAAFEMLSASRGSSGGGATGGGINDARHAFSRPHFAVTDEREKAYADREKEDAEAWRTGGVAKTA